MIGNMIESGDLDKLNSELFVSNRHPIKFYGGKFDAGKEVQPHTMG